jgi:hypothetical protein
MHVSMDKPQLIGQNLGRVFKFKTARLHAAYLWSYQVKLPNLKLKTQLKQPLGSLPLDFVLPAVSEVENSAQV